MLQCHKYVCLICFAKAVKIFKFLIFRNCNDCMHVTKYCLQWLAVQWPWLIASVPILWLIIYLTGDIFKLRKACKSQIGHIKCSKICCPTMLLFRRWQEMKRDEEKENGESEARREGKEWEEKTWKEKRLSNVQQAFNHL